MQNGEGIRPELSLSDREPVSQDDDRKSRLEQNKYRIRFLIYLRVGRHILQGDSTSDPSPAQDVFSIHLLETTLLSK